jgi:hypothetical protein
MSMAYANRLLMILAAAAAGAAWIPARAADRAATVEFTVGEVQVVSLNGRARAATKGLPLQSGDTVDTGRGRAQLRFTDGAYVSLQPQSKFRIDDYRFEGKTDGSERGFFSLLSGGMRTITGLVGRTNRRTYQVTTSVATIGIRGTEYKIAYTNSIVGAVGEGAIDVCTGAGCFPFSSGESFLVPTPQSRPQLTDKQIDLPPEQPGDPAGGSFQESNQSTNGTGGGPLIAGNEVIGAGLPAGAVLTGTVPEMVMANNGDGLLVFDVSDVVFDSNGVPISVQGSPVGDVIDVGNTSLLAWWREPVIRSSIGTFTIVGIPTPFADVQALALARTVASYSMIGGTTPTGYQSLVAPSGPSEGKLLAATLTANFAAGSVDASVSVNMAGKQLDMVTKAMAISATPAGGAEFGGGTCVLSNGGCDMAGFFAGPSASGAGLVYSGNIYDPNTQQTVSASGAVGLQIKP